MDICIKMRNEYCMNTHIVGAHSLALTKGVKKLRHFPATMVVKMISHLVQEYIHLVIILLLSNQIVIQFDF